MNSSQVPHNNDNNGNDGNDGNNSNNGNNGNNSNDNDGNNGINDNGSSAKKLTAAVLKMKPKVRWLKSSFQAAN